MSRHCRPLKRAGGSDCAAKDGDGVREAKTAAQESARMHERTDEVDREEFITAAIVNPNRRRIKQRNENQAAE
jgi:hypothetical protein